jgi:hypothetical protein
MFVVARGSTDSEVNHGGTIHHADPRGMVRAGVGEAMRGCCPDAWDIGRGPWEAVQAALRANAAAGLLAEDCSQLHRTSPHSPWPQSISRRRASRHGQV